MAGLELEPQVTSRTHGANIGHGTMGPNGPKGAQTGNVTVPYKNQNLKRLPCKNDEIWCKFLEQGLIPARSLAFIIKTGAKFGGHPPPPPPTPDIFI